MKAALNIVPREALADESAAGAALAPAPAVQWEPALRARHRELDNWRDYMATASRVVGRFHGLFRLERFHYEYPVRLQQGTPRRLRKPYLATVAYTDWGPADAPVVLCVGGVANVAMRFHYLAHDLRDRWRIICMDWLGRGRSGWLASQTDYSLATYAEQLRQMIGHLGGAPVTILGSSMGGSAAIELAAREPGLVQRLVLNDVGPHIPASRRKRRAETIARHYVFRNPADLMRKVGASNKNDGPISEDIRFALSFHQTRWSEEEGGRVYRHDVRALQSYRADAGHSLNQWDRWQRVHCPILLIHGMQSDALLEPTIQRMARGKQLCLMRVPDTGHTPLLADRNQCAFIRQWLDGRIAGGREWSVLHAAAREPYPGNPVSFAPASALS